MTKTAFLFTLMITALASVPAQAQVRVFVASFGVDTNPCTATQPCRSFQHAHDTAPANSEIEVVDPAGYGPLTITHGISIQGHGFAGITQACNTCAAITVNITTGDPVSLNGLLIDGGGTGQYGIDITSARSLGGSVQILNSVVRHFSVGIRYSTGGPGTYYLFEDTIASDNLQTGFAGVALGLSSYYATLNRITANNNGTGVSSPFGNTTISNSVLSNNSVGVQNNGGVTWLAKNVISGNGTGVNVGGVGGVLSYGDNYINNNTTPVSGGTLTLVGMQ
jgi:hypothetical protein